MVRRSTSAKIVAVLVKAEANVGWVSALMSEMFSVGSVVMDVWWVTIIKGDKWCGSWWCVAVEHWEGIFVMSFSTAGWVPCHITLENAMSGAQWAGKTNTSSSLRMDERWADVIGLGGGSTAAREAVMVGSVQSLVQCENWVEFSTRVFFGSFPQKVSLALNKSSSKQVQWQTSPVANESSGKHVQWPMSPAASKSSSYWVANNSSGQWLQSQQVQWPTSPAANEFSGQQVQQAMSLALNDSSINKVLELKEVANKSFETQVVCFNFS